MPTLDRNGVRIHYEVHGSGPTVLLTSGYRATSEMWQPNIAALSQRYRIIAWDMRGHGRTDSPDDPAAYSEEATVADMAALLDAAGAGQATIGGLSLGGYMTLAFHLAHPERVQALMLFATGPGYKKDEPRAAWNRRADGIAKDLEDGGLAALQRSAQSLRSHHSSVRGIAHAARGMLAQRDGRIICSLDTIKVPTLVLAGTKDEPYLAATDYMAMKIPGAVKVLVPDAGHTVNIDQPDAFNRAVLAFLAGVYP